MATSSNSPDKVMPKRTSPSTLDMLVWAIIAVQLIVGIYGFIVLPDTVPIHWGANGQPNGYGPKWVDTFLFPLISLGLYLLIRGLIVAGPRLGGRQSTNANLQIAKIIVVGIILFMLIVQLLVIEASLNVGFDMATAISLAVSVLFVFIGNFMGRMRRNFWMGIRTPWILTHSTVWERTHRLGGWLFVAVGLIGIVSSFIPFLRLWGLLVPLIAVTIFLVVYSYVYYQQVTRGGHETLSPPFDADS